MPVPLFCDSKENFCFVFARVVAERRHWKCVRKVEVRSVKKILWWWIKCILDCVDYLNEALGNVVVPMGAVSLCNQRTNVYFVKCETCLLSNIDGICHHLRGFLTPAGAGDSFRCPKELGVTSNTLLCRNGKQASSFSPTERHYSLYHYCLLQCSYK